MATQPWYDYPIPQKGSHAAGDDGDDIDAPDNTPLFFPGVGQVIDASYHVYGGQVVVHMPNGFDEYFIHMNHIDVAPGDWIAAGQQVGTSGGGVGDLVLHDGKVQPAQSQNWYQGHSSGYHTEFGEFEDNSSGGSMSQFNQGFGNHSRQRDPTPLIDSLRSGLIKVKLLPLNSTTPTGLPPLPDPGQALNGAATQAINSAVSAFGFSSPQNMLQRVGVGLAGALIAVLGLYVAAQPEIQQATTTVAKTASKAALL